MNDFAGRFGDKRRPWALARLEQAMVSQPSVVVRRLGDDRAGEMSVHRVLSAPAVTAGGIVECLAQRTARAAVARRVVVAQDTTEVNFPGHSRKQLGPAGRTGKTPGFFFGIIYVVTVFHYSLEDANALFNWNWAANALALVAAGLLSDRLRVRKPFMLVGGIGAGIMVWLYLLQAGGKPSFETLAVISCAQAIFAGMAYVTWMASFTETVEARNPALTATGLAVWGWIIRVVVTACLALLPSVVMSVNPLIEAPYVTAAYEKVLADKAQPSAELVAALEHIKQAAAAAPGEWQTWFWICIVGVAFFIATIFLMRGRWSPAAARADDMAHDAAVARELEALSRTARQAG